MSLDEGGKGKEDTKYSHPTTSNNKMHLLNHSFFPGLFAIALGSGPRSFLHHQSANSETRTTFCNKDYGSIATKQGNTIGSALAIIIEL